MVVDEWTQQSIRVQSLHDRTRLKCPSDTVNKEIFELNQIVVQIEQGIPTFHIMQHSLTSHRVVAIDRVTSLLFAGNWPGGIPELWLVEIRVAVFLERLKICLKTKIRGLKKKKKESKGSADQSWMRRRGETSATSPELGQLITSQDVAVSYEGRKSIAGI